MKKLPIEIPEGYEFDTFDAYTSEILLKEKPVNVMDRIKTVDDVLRDHCFSREEIDSVFRLVPERLKHQYIAELMVKSLNEGWEPDWEEASQGKYHPLFDMGGLPDFRYEGVGYRFSTCHISSRFYLRSAELAEYAGTQFIDLYRKFMI